MQTFASFVVHSFSIFWRCGLSGFIFESFVISGPVFPFVVLLNLILMLFSCLWFRNDGMEDRYSILIRFDSQDSTDDFYKHFNGSRFSSLEVFSTNSVLYTYRH